MVPKAKKGLEEPPANSTRAKTGSGNTYSKAEWQPPQMSPADSSDNEGVNIGAKAKSLDTAKPKKAKVTTKDTHTKPSKVDGHPVKIEKTHPGGDRVEVEPEELGKRKKSKSMKAKANDGTTTEPAHPKPKLGRPSKADKEAGAATAKDLSKVTTAVDPSSSEGKPLKVKKSQRAERTARKNATIGTTQTSVLTNRTSKEPNSSGKRSGETADMAEIPPGVEVDDSVFDALLATEKDTQPIEENLVGGKSEPTKAAEKPTRDERNAGPGTKGNSKAEKKVKDRSKKTDKAVDSLSKGRKRKAAAADDETMVEPDVTDPLRDLSAKKKQKKQQLGAFDAVESMLGSSIDSAKKRAKAVVDYAGDVVGSAQKSIMGGGIGEAEGVVDQRQKKKSKAGLTGEDPADDQDEEAGFDETDLLKGFESSGDERDGEDVGYEEGKAVPAIEKAKIKKVKAAQKSAAQGPGFIYIGRVPHGFYEHQMRAYFGQFGNISRLRLSRNKTTGRSKHFGFIEFESEEVAKIVAQTMDNYLLFGHILKVKLVPKEQLHPDTFKGANKHFKQIPWAQIEGRKLAMPASREQWEKRVEAEGKKRQRKAEQMREIGYEIDAPLKKVDQVPIQGGKNVIENARSEEEQTLITGGDDKGSMMVISEITKKPKKPKANIQEAEGRVDAKASTVSKGKRKAEDGLEKVQNPKKGKKMTDQSNNRSGKAPKATVTATVKSKKGKD
ncbi:MAG: hypothetical protein Q9191_005391 [Dirinaria sp. TL-2023a]